MGSSYLLKSNEGYWVPVVNYKFTVCWGMIKDLERDFEEIVSFYLFSKKRVHSLTTVSKWKNEIVQRCKHEAFWGFELE